MVAMRESEDKLDDKYAAAAAVRLAAEQEPSKSGSSAKSPGAWRRRRRSGWPHGGSKGMKRSGFGGPRTGRVNPGSEYKSFMGGELTPTR